MRIIALTLALATTLLIPVARSGRSELHRRAQGQMDARGGHEGQGRGARL